MRTRKQKAAERKREPVGYLKFDGKQYKANDMTTTLGRANEKAASLRRAG